MFYANAVRIERNECWRMVSRADGYRKGSPTGCSMPVVWSGAVRIGPKRHRVDSCDGHVDGLEDVPRV